MHYIKIILLAIALELCACFGLISPKQENAVQSMQEKSLKEQLINIHKDRAADCKVLKIEYRT